LRQDIRLQGYSLAPGYCQERRVKEEESGEKIRHKKKGSRWAALFLYQSAISYLSLGTYTKSGVLKFSLKSKKWIFLL